MLKNKILLIHSFRKMRMFHRLNGKIRCFRFQNTTDTTIRLPIPILSSTLPTSSLFNDYYFLRYICLCKDPNRLYTYILLTDSLSIYCASMLIYNLILIIRRQYFLYIYTYIIWRKASKSDVIVA